jgi:hypothetical protein
MMLASMRSRKEALLLDSVCHCLTVDVARLAGVADATARYAAAMAATGDHSQLQSHTIALINIIDACDISIAYVSATRPPTLHVNFNSHAALARALSRYTFLVRCGSASGASSWSPRHCGVDRNKQPELLQLSCVPSRTLSESQVSTEIATLLREMSVEHTTMWVKDASMAYQGAQAARIIVYLLPRHIQRSHQCRIASAASG